MITDNLKTILADHIEGFLIVRSYHWNIEGINFDVFHHLFDEIASDYYNQLDIIGEFIRVISDTREYVNATVDIVRLNKTIKAVILTGEQPIEMSKEIAKINAAFIHEFNELFELAEKENILSLMDYSSERIRQLEKLDWKLHSIIKGK